MQLLSGCVGDVDLPARGGSSGFKVGSSLELRGELELGLGSASVVKGDLLKIAGWQAGGAKEHFARLKIAQMFYLIKDNWRKSPVGGGVNQQ